MWIGIRQCTPAEAILLDLHSADVLTADDAMKTRVKADPLLLLLLLLPLRGLLELATVAAECGSQSCFSGSHTCACGMLLSC